MPREAKGVLILIFISTTLVVLFWSAFHKGGEPSDPYVTIGGERILADSPWMRRLFVMQMNISGQPTHAVLPTIFSTPDHPQTGA
jgi:hypothetical protein